MTNYKLTAERHDAGHDVRDVAVVGSHAEATHLVEEMETDDTWPEGFEAVLTDLQTGERWMYTDRWERLNQ